MLAAGKFNPKKKEIKFTDREREIITLICKGNANKQIASFLEISIRTVEGHRQRIQEKMEVQNTASLVIYAIDKGLYMR